MVAVQSGSQVDWSAVFAAKTGMRANSKLPPWVRLPSLPSALMEFVQKSNDPTVAAEDLARVIEKDAGLTGLLLRYINCAASGFRFKASTAQEAIVRLGINPCKMFLLTQGINEVMKSCQSKLVNFKGFWCSNLERGLFARRVARGLGVDGDVAFAGSMLCDALLPVLTNNASRTYTRFLGEQDTTPRPIVEFEEKEFGWNHALATALLLDGWEFPHDLVCCVLLHHNGPAILDDFKLKKTPVAAVAIAALVPDQLRQVPNAVRSLVDVCGRIPGFDMLEAARAVEDEFRQFEQGVVNPLPMSRRLQVAR